MRDILLSVVFMLNMGFIVLFAIDFLKRYKTNESSGKNDEADENSKDVTEHEPTFAPVRKAGIGKSKFSMDDVRRIAAKASEIVSAAAAKQKNQKDNVASVVAS